MRPSSAKPAPKASAKSSTADSAQIEELNATIASLQGTVEGLEKERDFYFGKLREVEVLCQGAPDAQKCTSHHHNEHRRRNTDICTCV